MKDKTTNIFADAPIPKAVISNVVPSIISMLMVLVYNLADTFFIGQTKKCLYGSSCFGGNAGVPAFYGSWHALWHWRNVPDF